MKTRTCHLKIFLLIGFAIQWQAALAQDTLKITSKVDKVVVFLKGAQVNRKAESYLEKGTILLNFTKLSSKIDPKSIQVKSPAGVSLQSVYFAVNHLDSLEKKVKADILIRKRDSLESQKLVFENTLLVLKNEQELFQENLVLSGEKKIVNTEELKNASAFYRERLSEIVKLRFETLSQLKNIDEQVKKISDQLVELNTKAERPVGEIFALFSVDEVGLKVFDIEYFISSAGWTPKYELRSESVSKPAGLKYRADVFQDTDDNWENVALSLSTSNPSLGATKPELQSWKLDLKSIYGPETSFIDNSKEEIGINYYENLKKEELKQKFSSQTHTITGTVVAKDDGMGLPGVSIRIKGTSIGTITDLNGNYTLNVPVDAQKIIFEFMGMETKEQKIVSPVINCQLASSDIAMDEVVVTAYGIKRSKKELTYSSTELVPDGFGGFNQESLVGSAAGLQIRGQASLKKERKKKIVVAKTLSGLNQLRENQTSVQFQLDKPYTIPSDNKNYAVDIEDFEIPVDYQYSSVPKLDASAFLLAQLTGWEGLNLLSGNVSIFFEGAFVGNSMLDVEKTGDTLDISMGRDKSIMIDRSMKQEFVKNQSLSKWRTELYTWEIVVRNNKTDSIKVDLADQIPVSENENCLVELLESSNAQLDKNKGELNWKIELAPLEKKTLTFKYQIKTKKI